MVTDTQLVAHLHQIISISDLETTTADSVRRRLEADLGVDLSRRRIFIVAEIDKFLHGHDAVNEFVFGQERDDEERQIGDGVVRNDTVQRDLEQGRGVGDVEEDTVKGNEKKRIKGKKSVKTTDAENQHNFHKLCVLSPQLQKLLGVAELSRTEVQWKLWAYIKEHNLQSPKDGRIIMCDDALCRIFRVRKISMLDMNKELSSHISSLDKAKARPMNTSAKGSQLKEKRQEAHPVNTSRMGSQPKRKRQEASTAKSSRNESLLKIRRQLDRLEKKEKLNAKHGIRNPTPISDALVKFIGTGETELSRTEAVKRLWQYIKQNNLQDPTDKIMVLCDDKLKELLEVDSFHGFALAKLLHQHFVKKN